ncbi:concanavalin A-like lectin/glucanase domain-containing protein, partial [Butyriboletus roseoflavus]
GTFDYATATFTVPTATGDDGTAMMFVGIDGAGCQTAALQAGINITITNKAVSYGGERRRPFSLNSLSLFVHWTAWYQWVPANFGSFPNIIISGGDVLAITIVATSSTRTDGLVILHNLTTSRISAQELNSTQPLCQENVEWVVGDPLHNDDPVHLTNFGSVMFSHAYASG